MLDEELEKEIELKTIREICWHWCEGHVDDWHHEKVDRCVLRKKAWCKVCLRAVEGRLSESRLLEGADENKKHRRFQPIQEGNGGDVVSEQPTVPPSVEPTE